ncbi:cysteine-rich receptor-like protein kinase 25 [Macadamia integrifolia]|uniref:cysteine-rich receptor-like protein kinase 25 n=1 Tax=Macadamia integrifolia TaxID=60698 RepID=UPI001C52AFBE|nr:cysteine-rich receptor-like protein kinase 25 [Macadamia integrifolia]
MLRYSNDSFFSTITESHGFNKANPQSLFNVTRFDQLVEDNMKKATTAAASDSKRFATQEATFTQFQNLYCLAQCSPDLSGNDCNSCLVGAIADLPNCSSGKQGGRVLNPSCNIRYELYLFYQVTALASSPSPALLPLTLQITALPVQVGYLSF